MTIYFIIIISLAVLHIFHTRVRLSVSGKVLDGDTLLLFEIFLILMCIYGLRADNVGIDIAQYRFRYENYLDILENPNFSSEIGFSYINYIFNTTGTSWRVYLASISALILFPNLYFLYKNSKNFLFSVFIFITIGNFSMTLSGIRQSLAISLCLLAYIILTNNENRIKYIISSLLIGSAYFIHNSAIVFLMIYPFMFLRIGVKTIWLCLIGLLAVYIFPNYFAPVILWLSPSKYGYIGIYENYNINQLLIVIAFVITIFCITFYNKSPSRNFNQKDSVLFLMSLANILFIVLSVNNNQIGRLAYYFSMANAVLISNTIESLKKRDRAICFPIIIIVCMIYFYLSTYEGTLHIDNFQFYWE